MEQASTVTSTKPGGEEIEIRSAGVALHGALEVPDEAIGLVVFAHGSGSGRHSPRNRKVARFLCEGRIGTLLFDLLTSDEEAVDAVTRELRFDIEFLAERLSVVTDWLAERADGLPLGYFGSSTGAAAALLAAAESRQPLRAIVSRGGRPDLAGSALEQVRAATLLIVGAHDPVVLELNRKAFAHLRCEKDLVVVPGATHLFEEPGKLEEAAAHARTWFERHLP